MASHHVRVKPIRVKTWDDDEQCNISRVVAYRLECSCGARSGSSASVRQLAPWRRAHLHHERFE